MDRRDRTGHWRAKRVAQCAPIGTGREADCFDDVAYPLVDGPKKERKERQG